MSLLESRASDKTPAEEGKFRRRVPDSERELEGVSAHPVREGQSAPSSPQPSPVTTSAEKLISLMENRYVSYLYPLKFWS